MKMFGKKSKDEFKVDKYYKIVCRTCGKEIPSEQIEKHVLLEH